MSLRLSSSAAMLLALSLVAGATPALAQKGRHAPPATTGQGTQGTPQERAACRPDARRFCREFGDDSTRVLSCLQEHRGRLSRSCRGVLERNGM